MSGALARMLWDALLLTTAQLGGLAAALAPWSEIDIVVLVCAPSPRSLQGQQAALTICLYYSTVLRQVLER